MRTSRVLVSVGAALVATLTQTAAAHAAAEDTFGSFRLATATKGGVSVVDQRLTGPYVQQSFAGDFTTGTDLYFTQVYDKATGAMAVTKTDLAGNPTGHMILQGAGHGRGIGLYHAPDGSLDLITEAWAVQDQSTGKWFGTRLALTPWQAGATVDLSNGAPAPVNGRYFDPPQCVNHVSPSVDESSREIGVSCGATDGSRHWYVWDLATFVAGQADYAHPLHTGTWPTQRATGNGWTLWGSYVYELEGDKYTSTNPYVGNTTLKSLSFDGPWQEQWTTIADVPNDPTYGYVEPEGVGVVPAPDGAHLAYGLAANNNYVGSSTSIGYHPVNIVSKPREFLAPPTPPAAPTGLTANVGAGFVDLSWGVESSATGYVVSRSTVSGAETTLATVGATTSYRDTAVAGGTTYYYTVKATNSLGTSAASNEATAAIPVTAPSAPQSLTVTAGKTGTKTLTLAWKAPASNGGAPITGYTVYRGTAAGKEVAVSTVPTTSYVDKALTKGTRYYYRVTASNSAGESAMSAEVSGVPK